MSAPAGYQPGSFRGVPFVTEDQSQSGGQRIEKHEFPQGDKPVLEFFGRRGAEFTINCHIIGEDWLKRADAFARALDAAGVGTLIHPWLGSMQVGVPEWSRADSATGDGGMTTFAVTYWESGLPAVPRASTDTSARAIAAAKDTANAAPAKFANTFSVAKATAFVENAAAELVRGAALVTSVQAGLLGGIGPALRAFQTGYGALGGASVLVRNALDLGLATVGMIQTVSALGDSAIGRIGAFTALMGWGADLPAVDGTTPARQQQRDNQAAFVQLVNLAAAGELVRAVAGATFASYQDAIATRDAAADRLEQLALRQADAGDDDGQDAYDALRAALIADVTARGGTLARLQGYTPAITLPALVIAYSLYGDPAKVEGQADEIVARNRIAHPGFVPGGQALQVVTPDLGIQGLGGGGNG